MTVDEVPNIDGFRPLVLRVLSDGKPRAFRQVCTEAADLCGLSEAARSERVSSGQERYLNRLGWACSALHHAWLVTRPKRGHYEITEPGRVVDARNLSSYSENDMLEWPAWVAYQEEVAARRRTRTTAGERGTEPAGPAIDPLEAMETAVEEYNAATETELRQALQSSSPEFFERAVVDLLWAMGYGGTHGEKEHVGRAGDGGIDGVIRQDALGLQNVYIQAKRYADDNSVQRPAIQQFYGALASRNADRGVFITTSRFSQGARHEAQGYHGKTIVLIDGIQLTRMMLNYGVAVQRARAFTLFRVDEDYFDDERP